MALNQVDISMMEDIPAPGVAGKIIISDGTGWTSGENAPVGAVVRQATDPTPTDPATPTLGDMILNTGNGKLFNCTDATAGAAVWTQIGVIPEVVDLTPIKQDISLLALQNAINGNLSAYGLKNSWIEQFENSTFIENLSSVSRVASGEYVSSFYSSEGAETEWDYVTNNVAMVDKSGGTAMSSNSYALGSSSAPSWFASLWGTLTGGSQATLWANPSTGYATGFTTDFGANYTFSKFSVGKARSYGDVSTFRIRYSDDGTNWTVLDMTGASVDSYHGGTSPLPPSGGGEVTNFDSTGVMDWELTGQGDKSVAAIISGFTQFSARHLAFEIGTWSANGNNNVGFSNWRWWYKPTSTVASATGSFTSTAIVPQDATNKSSVGLVVLYKDNGSSSCTLNTDIVAKVRANTGQAYQTLVLAGAGTYSDSLKIAIAPAISVTAGQALSYEISFANQASGTKEARIYGVAMTY